MKSDFFLALPIMVTLFNVFLSIVLYSSHSNAQHPIGVREAIDDHCIGVTGEACETEFVLPLGDTEEKFELDDVVDDNEEDPNLLMMPVYPFKAYVRADISSFYRENPGSRVETKPKFPGQAGKFVNMSPETLDLYWDGPNGPVLNDRVKPFSAGGTSAFPSHKFIFTNPGRPDEVLCRITIVPEVSVYYCDPFADENSHPEVDPRARGEQLIGNGRFLDSLSSEDRAKYDKHAFNLKFGALYKNFTGGSEWLTMYPRSPPRHKIWRADYFGQEHVITTKQTNFVKIPPQEELHRLTPREMRHNKTTPLPFAEYREPGEKTITIKALSCAPRVFELRNFLSDAEVDHVLQVVQNRNLQRSTTNGHLSATRTSRTTWIGRDTDPVLDAIFRRVADVLRLDEALLRDRDADELSDMPTRQRINEDLQIVHYDKVSVNIPCVFVLDVLVITNFALLFLFATFNRNNNTLHITTLAIPKGNTLRVRVAVSISACT